ncbi:MAG: hypothetical protein OXI25_01750 [Chloroflexota bacterium]|nr:hypothetical protein [Chloroflexota bacterium]
MKISQIAEYSLPGAGGLPPLQAMVYEEIMRRSDEVFEYQGDELLRVFPRLKRSALNWSLWLLAKGGHISRMKVRVNGKLTTVYGSHEAVAALKERLHMEREAVSAG